MDLIETLLSRHGIRSLRFDGSMDRAHRDATLTEFKKAGGPKIILISTKCGSVGLNLVAANRIVKCVVRLNVRFWSDSFLVWIYRGITLRKRRRMIGTGTIKLA